MSFTFDRAVRRPGVFRRLTSFTVDEFILLAEKLKPEWFASERKRLEGKRRGRSHPQSQTSKSWSGHGPAEKQKRPSCPGIPFISPIVHANLMTI